MPETIIDREPWRPKRNLVAFHYGNLTHPSADPPRMGFLSTVPGNADDLYGTDVQAAKHDGKFVGAYDPLATNTNLI